MQKPIRKFSGASMTLNVNLQKPFIRSSSGFTTNTKEKQAQNALDILEFSKRGMSKGVSPFDGFWLLFSIEKKLALTVADGCAIIQKESGFGFKTLKRGNISL